MVFLDLEIEKVLQAAHHIRNDLNDEETAIVIMSPSENCSSEIIKVHPLDYLVYPLDYEKTSMCINNYLGTRQMNSELFKYTRKRCKYQIPVSKIVYSQSNGKKIILHTKNEAIDFYGRLSDCINNKCFKKIIQIHQSFFVNSECIEKISQNHLILNGNVRLPMSRQRKKNVKEYFKN